MAPRYIDEGAKIFATKHVDKLTSREILEAAFAALRSRTGSSVRMPAFSNVADVVADDQARFSEAVDELLREVPDARTTELRDAAIAGMVEIRTDGHSVDGAVLSGDARMGVKIIGIIGPNGDAYNNVGVKPDIEAKSSEAVDAAPRYPRGPVLAAP